MPRPGASPAPAGTPPPEPDATTPGAPAVAAPPAAARRPSRLGRFALEHSPRLRRARRTLVRWDLAGFRLLRSGAQVDAARPAVRAYSRLGEHGGGWIALALAGAALQPDRRREWLRTAAAVGASHGFTTSVKVLIARRRPGVEDLPALISTGTGLSFPSSHASSAFCAARLMRPALPAGPLYGAATLMAASRVYLGVHYPTDVLVGAALGSAIGSLVAEPRHRTRPR